VDLPTAPFGSRQRTYLPTALGLAVGKAPVSGSVYLGNEYSHVYLSTRGFGMFMYQNLAEGAPGRSCSVADGGDLGSDEGVLCCRSCPRLKALRGSLCRYLWRRWLATTRR